MGVSSTTTPTGKLPSTRRGGVGNSNKTSSKSLWVMVVGFLAFTFVGNSLLALYIFNHRHANPSPTTVEEDDKKKHQTGGDKSINRLGKENALHPEEEAKSKRKNLFSLRRFRSHPNFLPPPHGKTEAGEQDSNVPVARISSSNFIPIPTDAISWLDETENVESIHHIYHENTYPNKELYALRTLDTTKISSLFNGMCSYTRFNISSMPQVSIIIPIQQELPGILTATVHNLLGRTPPQLLKEIILVDDNGPSRQDVNETEFQTLQQLSPKISLITNKQREGVARSRLIGARRATATVLMFADSHIEMLRSTWLQHLLVPIMEQPRNMALQVLDVMSDVPPHLYYQDGQEKPKPPRLGTMNREFQFAYQEEIFPYAAWSEKPSSRLPYETPTGPGSLFAVRADEFWRVGGYDEGLYLWGGENLELSLKFWMCGGRLVFVPCSRCGHMYRVHSEAQKGRWPPEVDPALLKKLKLNARGKLYKYNGSPASDFVKVVQRNNLRVVNTWIGSHPAKYDWYSEVFSQVDLAPEWKALEQELQSDPAIQEQRRLQKENQCRDFAWFDRHVMMRLLGVHHPWHASFGKRMVKCGAHKAVECGECPLGHGSSWCNGECKWCGVEEGEGVCVNATDPKACPL